MSSSSCGRGCDCHRIVDALADRGDVPVAYEDLVRATVSLGHTHRRAEAILRCPNLPRQAREWMLDRFTDLVAAERLAVPECVVVGAASIPQNARVDADDGRSRSTLLTAGFASGAGAYALSSTVREVPTDDVFKTGFMLSEVVASQSRQAGLATNLPVVFTGAPFMSSTRSALSMPDMIELRRGLDEPVPDPRRPSGRRTMRHAPMIAEIPFTAGAFLRADYASLLLRGEGYPMVRRARGNRAIRRTLLDLDSGRVHPDEQRFLESAFMRRTIGGFEILISALPGFHLTSPDAKWVAHSRIGLVRELAKGDVKPPVAVVEIVDGAGGPTHYRREDADRVFNAISTIWGAGKKPTADCLNRFHETAEATLYRHRGARKPATRDVQLNLVAARHLTTGPSRVRNES